MHTWGKVKYTQIQQKVRYMALSCGKYSENSKTQTCPVWTFCLGCRSSALHQSWGDHRELEIESKEQRRVRRINKDTHITVKNKVRKRDLTMFSIDNWKVVICLMISLSRFTSFTHCAKSWKHKWMSYQMCTGDNMNWVINIQHTSTLTLMASSAIRRFSLSVGSVLCFTSSWSQKRHILHKLGKFTCMGAMKLYMWKSKNTPI